MGNKLKELGIYAQLHVYDLVGMMETCWMAYITEVLQ